jgi:serine/threonine protein kinase
MSPNRTLADPAVAYTLLEKLGTGSFGTVWKAYVRLESAVYAARAW